MNILPPSLIKERSLLASGAVLICNFTSDRVASADGAGHIIDELDYTRASETLMADAAGGHHIFAANDVAQTNLGMKVSPAVINLLHNTGLEGASLGVLGATGSLPTGWFANLFAAVEVLGIGTENGLPFIEVHLVCDNTGGAGNLYPYIQANQIIGDLNGNTYTFSSYLKRVAGSFSAALNVTQVSVGGAEGTSYPAGYRADNVDEIERFITTFTITKTNTITLRPRFFLQVVTPGELLDVTIRLYAPQLELGSYPNDPVITDEDVTGVSDAITVFDDVSEFDLSEFTIYAEFKLNDYGEDSYPSFISLIGDADNVFTLFSESNNIRNKLYSKIGGVNVWSNAFSPIVVGGITKICLTGIGNEIKYYKDGLFVGNITLSNPLASSTFNRLYFGCDYNGNRHLITEFKKSIIFDTALTDAQCMEMTS